MTDTVYTIGHSNHPAEKLIGLLKRHSITAVCDVRSQPHSRMNPQFNRDTLKDALHAENIKYVFLGKELGARSDDDTCYINGQVQYDLLAKTTLFKHGITRVKDGASTYRIALMCAEKEPLDCHRTILVARELFAEGINVKHIHANGELEEHAHAIERLILKLGIPQNDMFRSNDEVVSEAYSRQSNEIAYRESPAPNELVDQGTSRATR